MSFRLLIIIATLFAITAISICAVFLRPAPTQTAAGTITKKTFKPAGTYWQYPPDLNRGFRIATPIPIAEAYIFEIAAESFPAPLYFSRNTIASNAFQVGQRVQVTYKERTVPLLWKRLYVLDMTPR